MAEGEPATAEKVESTEELLGERTAPAPEFKAPQPEVAGWAAGTGALCPLRRLPAEDESARLPGRHCSQWVGTSAKSP